MFVYIASPFFNPEQLSFVKKIEQCLFECEIGYFSPRKHGVVSEIIKSKEAIEGKEISTEEKMRIIYDKNIEYLNTCETMICVVDNKDVGTMFELGYFSCIKERLRNSIVRIITITNEGHGLNLMLRFASDCHIKKFEKIQELLIHINNIQRKESRIEEKRELEEYLYSRYDDPEKVVE